MIKRYSRISKITLLLAGFLLPLLMALFPPTASAATTSPTVDKERRRLRAAVNCLNQSIIDEDDDLEPAGLSDQYSDLFDDAGRKETVVVGFDLDSDNGVMTCRTVVQAGIIAAGLARSNDAAMRYFIERLTGSAPSEEQEIKPNDNDVINRMNALKADLQEELNGYEGPNTELRRVRFAPLVNLCFTASPWSPSPPAGYDEGSGDFRVSDVGYFQQKDGIDWKKDFNWIDANDGLTDTGAAAIGDITLGFKGAGLGGGDWKQNDSDSSSDFYPIGSDINPPRGQGYLEDAIVDCHFVKKNANIIFTDDDTVDQNGWTPRGPDGRALSTTSAAPTTTNASNGITSEDNSCESGAGATGWIICKILELVGGALNFLDSMLEGMLNVDESYLENAATEEIWKRFRDIAYLILVPVFLFMVISTALGFEFVSAYTVKKALPRLVIATIFIALSFEISKFLIIMVNDIGGGMLGLMSNAGGDQINNLEDLFEPGWFSGAGLLALLGAGATGVAVAGLVGVFAGAVSALIGFLGAAAIAILVVLLLLGFRQVLIIALAILSPLAILSWIFPGNDKLWNLWKDSFTKLLLLYPVIMLTLGAGRLFAGMVGDVTITDGEGQTAIVESTLNTIIKLCAYVLPYFLIPFLFKTAGGLFANISGMTNNRQKGLMDRSRNWGRGRREDAQKGRKDALASRRATRASQRWIDRGARGGVVGDLQSRAGRRFGGLDEEDTSVLQANVGQHALRGRTAIEQMKKQRFGTATYDLNQETVMANRLRSSGSHIIPPNSTPQQTQAAVDAMGTLQYLRYTSVNDSDDYRRQAAIAQLVQQQDIAGLDYVRQQGITRGRAGDPSIRNSYNQQVPDNYGAMKSMSPDLAKEVNPALSDAAIVRDALTSFETVSTDHHAGMKPAAWEKWKNLDEPAARAAYNAVVSDPQAGSKLANEVHDLF